MAKNQESDNSNESEVNLGVLDTFWQKYNAFRFRGTELWDHIAAFSKWFELDAADLAKRKNHDHIRIDLTADGQIRKLWIGGFETHENLLQHSLLWEYLISLGIHTLCLDPRLEMNQIQDVFVFLKSMERSLLCHDRKGNNTASTAFLEGKSIHFSCATLTLDEHVLYANYSYCTLKYSKFVHFLEKTNRRFHDHRSLFYMAPRYGLLLAVVILAPSLVLAGMHGEWYIFSLLVAAAITLYGITFIFLMVVGSVEYDNEEKNYRLSRAYSQLKLYASRIQADIRRAQTIQRCFLPDTTKMPMAHRIDWASSYKPAEEVGGDYFDIQQLGDDRIVIIFGDVCGHGMAAALITAVLKTTFQAWIEAPTNLEQLTHQLNRNICLTTPIGDFAAVFLAILDCRSGVMEYINCGHNPEPWLLTPENGPIRQLNGAPCMILGIEKQMEIQKSTTTLKAGDGILIVSDGIIENQDVEGNLYSRKRFEALVQENATLSISELAELITGQAESFSKGTSLNDDQTLLAFRLKTIE